MNHLRISYCCFLIFLLPPLSFVQGQSSDHNPSTTVDCRCDRERDSLSLLSLYLATNGPNWKQSWDLDEPISSWYGIELGPEGCVRTIDMDGDPQFSLQRKNGNGLKGTLPDLYLPSLRNLLLASNRLSGEIPNFSKMPYLRVVQLSCNQFNGIIPEFTHVPNLKALELDYNKLQGTIPEFDHTPNLESLYLLNNQLRGSIPAFKNLPKLKYFIANNNQLSGELPDFRHLVVLKKLLLKNNQLSGDLPDLGHLDQLTHLDLSDNQIEGILFDWQFCDQLRYISFGSNQLSGTVPPIQALEKLEAFLLANNQLEGEIPDPSNLVQLHTFVVDNNHFTEAPVFQNTTALQLLAVNNNHLSFQHLLPNRPGETTVYQYEAQTAFEKDMLLVSLPDSNVIIETGIEVAIPGVQYQWYHNTELLEDAPSTNELLLKKVGPKNIGQYYCELTHPNLPGLQLRSTTTRLLVQNEAGNSVAQAYAVEDIFTIDACKNQQNLNLLQNDLIYDPSAWSITLLNEPEMGTLKPKGKGRFEYTAPTAFSGILTFEYQLCSVKDPDQCTETFVELIISQKRCEEDKAILIPSVISPNEDGLNDQFIISKLNEDPVKYQNNELHVFDVQGREVFYAKPYRNDWEGRFQHNGAQLPAGVYFYQFSTGLAHQKTQSGSLMIMK